MSQVIESQPDMTVVAQAANGQEAVTLTEQHKPDVILMDINMPEMDGVEASRQITAKHPETGIIPYLWVSKPQIWGYVLNLA